MMAWLAVLLDASSVLHGHLCTVLTFSLPI